MKKPRRPLRNKKEVEQKKPAKSKKDVESRSALNEMFKEYETKLSFYTFRIARLSDLLSRASASKMIERKRLKMLRQLDEANEEHTFIKVALDQIAFRMSQLPEQP